MVLTNQEIQENTTAILSSKPVDLGKLMIDMGLSGYQRKDAIKFIGCNKLIAHGSIDSSSGRYRALFKSVCNTGSYEPTDRVAVSVNGMRSNRWPLDTKEVLKAIKACATIVGDNSYDRSRAYNVGERELMAVLQANNYEEVDEGSGIWTPVSPF